jgi:hypothetical protein
MEVGVSETYVAMSVKFFTDIEPKLWDFACPPHVKNVNAVCLKAARRLLEAADVATLILKDVATPILRI